MKDYIIIFSRVFNPCITLIFQIPTEADDFGDDWWLKDGRDDRIYRQGRFILFDSTNDDCIRFGEFDDKDKLNNGEICVKTVTPTTKRGYYDGTDEVRVKVFEQIPLAKTVLLDYSYIGR